MNDRQGLPGKTGLDDLLFRVGPDQFRCFMADALDKTRSKCVSLGDVRRQMGLARLESLSVPGVYVDTSPPGTGKTQAGRAAMSAAGTSLTVLPTHRNCREFCRDLNRAGLTAEPYPQLTQGKGDVESPDYEPATCENYSEAAEALGYGLSPSVVICPTCTHGPAGSQSCEYQAQMKAAQDASHAVAPHKRASLGFATLARGRKCITIDEDATDIIRPTVSVGASFEVIIRLAAAIGARYAGRNNDTGRYAAWGFEDAARFLETSLSLTTVTQPLAMPEAVGLPHDFDRTTFVTIRESGLRPDPDAWKVCRAVVGGELAELTVRCDQVFSRGAEKKIHKAIMAVWKTQLPRGKTVWLNDATADIDALEHLIGLPIIDSTPRGVVQQLHQVTQYAADITRGTSPAVVLKILRAALAAYPAYRRIGVICHRPHAGTIRGTGKNEHRLAEAEQQRIVKVEYFKSGEGRGSNSWKDDCDLLIVAGTPRVPPSVVRNRLIQIGKSLAAARDGDWQRDYWSAVVVSGRKRRTITTAGYRDWDWHYAHRAIVRAELIQCVGRGRGICEDGIPVVVLSNEDLGLKVTEEDISPLPKSAHVVLDAMSRLSAQNPTTESGGKLSAQNPTIYIVGNTADKPPLTTQAIATAVGLEIRQVRYLLNRLHSARLVDRIGNRGGWILTTAPTQSTTGAAAGGGGDVADVRGVIA